MSVQAEPPSRRYSPSPPRHSTHKSRSQSRSRTPTHSRSKSPSRRHSASRSHSRSRSPVADASNPGNNLFVTGLSTRTTERDLEDYFSKEGKVVECRLVVDARSKASRGFAFITMDGITTAEKCIKYLNGTTLDGRVITVEKARRKDLEHQLQEDILVLDAQVTVNVADAHMIRIAQEGVIILQNTLHIVATDMDVIGVGHLHIPRTAVLDVVTQDQDHTPGLTQDNNVGHFEDGNCDGESQVNF